MIKYFCDKCGKEVGALFGECSADIFKVHIEPSEVRTLIDEEEAKDYIFCYACMKNLNRWVNQKDDLIEYVPIRNNNTSHIPEACKSCSNHPSNGGSGICNCTLGSVEVKC